MCPSDEWVSWLMRKLFVYILWFDELRCGCEKNYTYVHIYIYIYIYICSGTVGCGLQRRWTARYIGNGGMPKYTSSEDMEQIDWI
jgi:hypothetical protein